MKQNPVKLAVAGAGLIGKVHIKVIQDHPDCVLSAVIDPAPGAREWARQAGVPHFDSLDAVLAGNTAEGVVLATPNAHHVPQALQCLDAGLAVLVEKPVAPTVAEAEQLARRVDESKGRVLIGHHRTHNPILAQARVVIASGQLGRLVCVTGSATFFKPDQYFVDGPWRREAGGGPILINMIHEIHSLRLLCGEIVAVQAMTSSAVRGFAVEDSAAIILQFANGTLGTFVLSDTVASARSWEQTSGENPAYPVYGDEDCYVISGTLGTLSVPTMRIKRYESPAAASWWKPFGLHQAGVQHADPLVLQMEHFLKVVRDSEPPLVSARDGLQNLRVVEAIRKAASSGRRIDVPL